MIGTWIRKILALSCRAYRALLCYYFRFDKWHINSLHDRKYARDIIRFLNAKPETERFHAVEIGCGLGDILRRLNYTNRSGYDLDENALKAARFISAIRFNRNITFKRFKFPESELSEKSDTIILVNWIHHIPPEILRNNIQEYFHHHLSAGGEIVIDTVQDEAYKFNHSIGYLVSSLNCDLIKIGDDIMRREIFAIRKK